MGRERAAEPSDFRTDYDVSQGDWKKPSNHESSAKAGVRATRTYQFDDEEPNVVHRHTIRSTFSSLRPNEEMKSRFFSHIRSIP